MRGIKGMLWETSLLDADEVSFWQLNSSHGYTHRKLPMFKSLWSWRSSLCNNYTGFCRILFFLKHSANFLQMSIGDQIEKLADYIFGIIEYFQWLCIYKFQLHSKHVDFWVAGDPLQGFVNSRMPEEITCSNKRGWTDTWRTVVVIGYWRGELTIYLTNLLKLLNY